MSQSDGQIIPGTGQGGRQDDGQRVQLASLIAGLGKPAQLFAQALHLQITQFDLLHDTPRDEVQAAQPVAALRASHRHWYSAT